MTKYFALFAASLDLSNDQFTAHFYGIFSSEEAAKKAQNTLIESDPQFATQSYRFSIQECVPNQLILTPSEFDRMQKD
jgi:hypothetical protein